MSIVCAKNFAKFIGRPHRTRVPPRLEAQTCRRALIAARRTANAVTRARRHHTRPKTLFVSLKKPAEICRGAANRNTISILIPSPRTIIPCSSAAFRAERSLCNTNRIYARRRASRQDHDRLSAGAPNEFGARSSTLDRAKCPEHENTDPLLPFGFSSPTRNRGSPRIMRDIRECDTHAYRGALT